MSDHDRSRAAEPNLGESDQVEAESLTDTQSSYTRRNVLLGSGSLAGSSFLFQREAEQLLNPRLVRPNNSSDNQTEGETSESEKKSIKYTLRIFDSDGNQVTGTDREGENEKNKIEIIEENDISEFGNRIRFGTVGDARSVNDRSVVDYVRLENGQVIEDWEKRGLDAYKRTRKDGGEFKIERSIVANGKKALKLFSGCCGDNITSKDELLDLTELLKNNDEPTIKAEFRHQTDNSGTFGHWTSVSFGVDKSGNPGVRLRLFNPGTERIPGARIDTPNNTEYIRFDPNLKEFYTYSLSIALVDNGKMENTLQDLLDTKRTKIDSIRSAIPGTYLARGQVADEVASNYTASTRRSLDSLSTEDLNQRIEAFKRLNEAENITEKATREPINSIVSKSAATVLTALVASAFDGVQPARGLFAKARSTFLGRTARQGESVTDTVASGDSFSIRKRERINRQFETSKRAFEDTIQRESEKEKQSVIEAGKTVASVGFEAITNNQQEREKILDSLSSGFKQDVEEAVTLTVASIEALFFQVYYFGDREVDLQFDIDFNNIDLKEKYEVSVDIPDVISKFDEVPPEVEAELKIPSEIEDTINDIGNNIENLNMLVEKVGNILDPIGAVDDSLNRGAEIVREKAENRSLTKQSKKSRENISTAVQNVIGGITKLSDLVLSLANLIGKFVIIAQIAIVTLLITVGAAIIYYSSGIAQLALLGNLITFVGKLLGYLAVVDLVLITISLGVITESLDLIRKPHTFGVLSILTTDLERVPNE